MSVPEPERYELAAAPAYDFELARRELFGLVGGGLIVISLLREAFGQESGGGRRARGTQRVPADIDAWLHLNEDGGVTIYTGKAEVGQNIRTELTQVVADELHVPMAMIRMVMADTGRTPYDAGTFGSRTTPDMASRLRKIAAAAREVLLDLAADKWKAERDSLYTANGKVTNQPTGQSISFQQLTQGKKLMKTVPDSVAVAAPGAWTVTGKSAQKVDGRSFVTGQHQFSSDVRIENTLYGKVLRPPVFGATLVSVDTKAAEAIPGVTVVRDGDFVGVAGPNPESAAEALKAIQAEWKTTPQISSREVFDSFKPANAPAPAHENSLHSRYTVAYIAHVPLEPRAAAAEWKDGRLKVWTGTQRPFGVQSELAQAFHIPESQVRVIVPDTGSGYGGKHTGEAALEAARLAAGARRPVKLVWTREEEFTWAYARPAGVIEVSSRLD